MCDRYNAFNFSAQVPVFSLLKAVFLLIGMACLQPAAAQFTDMQSSLVGVGDATLDWADYDSDGDLDLIIAGQSSSGVLTQLYRNLGGNFVALDDLPFIHISLGEVAWGDYDNDGDPDLLLSGQKSDGNATTQLYRNNGNGTFTDMNAGITALKAGMLDWGDYDNDGRLDFFISGVGNDDITISKIYRNTGNWSGAGSAIFTDIGANIKGLRRGDGTWGDYDVDGDLDLLLTGRDTQNTRWSILYKNTNGAFSDSGIELPDVDLSGVDWRDYNKDGYPELLLTGTDGTSQYTRVYKNFHVAGGPEIVQGFDGLEFASAQWGDFDGDGMMGFAALGRNNSNQTRTLVLKSNGSFTFDDVNPAIISLYKGQLKWGDFDQDGDLDLALAGYDVADVPYARIYKNVKTTNNNPPDPPFSMYMHEFKNRNTFVWSDGLDRETGIRDLTYNLRIGTTPGGAEILAPTAAGNSGRGHARDFFDLPDGTYYWSVQTVDENLLGSAYAFEQVFEIGNDEFVNSGIEFSAETTRLGFGDLDNDGDLDIYMAGSREVNGSTLTKIYKNVNGSFVEQSTPLPQLRRGIIQLEDYDNDNDLDIVLQGNTDEAYDNANLVSGIFRNDNGSFVNTGIVPGNSGFCLESYPNRVLADVDNNGFVDIIAPFVGDSDIDPQLGVRLNQGGVFESTYTKWGQNFNSGTLAVGDHNSDGLVDLYSAGLDNSQCNFPWGHILTSQGTSFDRTAVTGAYSGWGGVPAWGDYDEDGDMDLVTTGHRFGQDDPGVRGDFSGVFENNGNSFTTKAELLATTFESATSWGDYDMDGDLDLLLTHTHGSPLYENRNGVFVNVSGAFGQMAEFHAAFGDYDGDDDLDVIVAGFDEGTYLTRIYKNTRGAKNDEPTAPTGLSASVNGAEVTLRWNAATDEETASAGLTYGLRIGTAPGKSDIMSARALADGTPLAPVYGNVYHNTQWTIKGLADGTYYWSVHAVDAGYMGSPFAAEQSFTVGAPPLADFVDSGISIAEIDEGAVAWGDYDNDNDLDLLIAGTTNNGAATKLYRNNGNTLVDSGIDFVDVDLAALDWGDYDLDGYLDFVVTGRGANETHRTLLYRNNGNGGFIEIDTGLPGLLAGSVDWGDFDNDGDADLLLTGRLSNLDNFSGVFRNVDGVFENINANLDGVRRGQSSWIDYDVDGDLDIILTGLLNDATPHHTVVYKNTNGVFEKINDGLPDISLGGIDWGDYDDDGDPDLLLAGKTHDDQILIVYRNDISTFTRTTAGQGLEFGNVRWGDYDNDNDLDYIMSGRLRDQTPTTRVYLDFGPSYSNIGADMAGVYKTAMAWGDYDNDNDLDVVVSGQVSEAQRIGKIYNNTSTIPNTPPVAPGGLSHEVGTNYLKLSWGQGNDAQTSQVALTYNLRVGTTPGGSDIVAPLSLANGWRQVAGRGNVGQNLSWIIKPLPPGIYYWSVQSIDHGYMGSAFAEEQSFVLTDPILPVELTDFTAQWSGKDIQLAWTTASESNNAGFEIQYQFDGAGGNGGLASNGTGVRATDALPSGHGGLLSNGASVRAIHDTSEATVRSKSPLQDAGWQSLAFVPGAGTSTGSQSYAYRIVDAAPGAYHFRLKQIDFDGAFDYSDVIYLEAQRPEAVKLMGNYPNPFNPSTEIRYDVPVGTHVALRVYDAMGKEIKVLVDQFQEAGHYSHTFDGSTLASGVYFYQLETPSHRLIRQMILLK